MDYLLVLDYDHLDEPVFLKSLANALGRLSSKQGLIVHGDSAYTERIIQTGVMSDEAKKRSIKDLNNRLIALFADSGISAVGLNGYQQDIIRKDDDKWEIKTDYLKSFPAGVNLVLTTLVASRNKQQTEAVSLAELVDHLASEMNFSEAIVFTKNDAEELKATESSVLPLSTANHEDDQSVIAAHLPTELHQLNTPLVITSTQNIESVLEKF